MALKFLAQILQKNHPKYTQFCPKYCLKVNQLLQKIAQMAIVCPILSHWLNAFSVSPQLCLESWEHDGEELLRRVGPQEDATKDAAGEPLVVGVPPEAVEVFAVVARKFVFALAINFALEQKQSFRSC